uniref:Uncharacterized protein n=1 Tax=Scleropages formosus TaxID=113540 RepID=A0A8C9SD60_SCLFO
MQLPCLALQSLKTGRRHPIPNFNIIKQSFRNNLMYYVRSDGAACLWSHRPVAIVTVCSDGLMLIYAIHSQHGLCCKGFHSLTPCLRVLSKARKIQTAREIVALSMRPVELRAEEV